LKWFWKTNDREKNIWSFPSSNQSFKYSL